MSSLRFDGPIGSSGCIETPFGVFDTFSYCVRIAVVADPAPVQDAEGRELDDALKVFEVDILDDDFSVILGRSGLKRLKLEYDGSAGTFAVTA